MWFLVILNVCVGLPVAPLERLKGFTHVATSARKLCIDGVLDCTSKVQGGLLPGVETLGQKSFMTVYEDQFFIGEGLGVSSSAMKLHPGQLLLQLRDDVSNREATLQMFNGNIYRCSQRPMDFSSDPTDDIDDDWHVDDQIWSCPLKGDASQPTLASAEESERCHRFFINLKHLIDIDADEAVRNMTFIFETALLPDNCEYFESFDGYPVQLRCSHSKFNEVFDIVDYDALVTPDKTGLRGQAVDLKVRSTEANARSLNSLLNGLRDAASRRRLSDPNDHFETSLCDWLHYTLADRHGEEDRVNIPPKVNQRNPFREDVGTMQWYIRNTPDASTDTEYWRDISRFEPRAPESLGLVRSRGSSAVRDVSSSGILDTIGEALRGWIEGEFEMSRPTGCVGASPNSTIFEGATNPICWDFSLENAREDETLKHLTSTFTLWDLLNPANFVAKDPFNIAFDATFEQNENPKNLPRLNLMDLSGRGCTTIVPPGALLNGIPALGGMSVQLCLRGDGLKYQRLVDPKFSGNLLLEVRAGLSFLGIFMGVFFEGELMMVTDPSTEQFKALRGEFRGGFKASGLLRGTLGTGQLLENRSDQQTQVMELWYIQGTLFARFTIGLGFLAKTWEREVDLYEAGPLSI